ncbi:hypothetical protein [Pseudoalteromonas denitrificans]|uniref:hypothetical protein n=1 Tax=Pseudoalteromonas denitrificans TaxID=43656 RepID=UPI0011608957|nr:hypothetical protein [Pseudoalteromonas denitrificans]
MVELKEQALKTYIVSYVEQKRLLKKDEKLEVKTQAKNIKKITKSNELKLEKVIKQKTNKLVIDKNINAEVQEDLTLKNQNKTKTFKKLNPYSGVSSIINQEYNRSRQDHYKLNL